MESVKVDKKTKETKQRDRNEEGSSCSYSSSHPSDLCEVTDADLKLQAAQFGSRIPPGTFTPAELQVYIFDHERSPCAALEGLDKWIEEGITAKPL